MNQFKQNLVVPKTELKKNTKPTKPKEKAKEIYYIMYDENKKKIGTINAEDEKLQDKWLKGVSIFVITEDGILILEKRSSNTSLTPEQTDLCSGHIDNNEKDEDAAYRELEEELGIKPKQILRLKKINSEVPLVFKGSRKFFIQFYASFIKRQKLKLQKEEVSSIIEVSLEEGFELIRQGKTKFPYEGKEEEFEQIFKEIRQFYLEQREKNSRENCLWKE